MTDDLDDLKALMRTTPDPDADAKAATIALAMQNFDKLHANRQETSKVPRLSPDRRKKREFMSGVYHMLEKLKSRGVLAAGTSLAALALGVVVVLPRMEAPRPAPAIVAEQPALAPQATTRMSDSADAVTAAKPAPMVAEMDQGGPLVIAEAPMAAAPLQRMAKSARPEGMILPQAAPNTETFANAPANALHITVEEPVSTFSIDVDTASYSIIRNSLLNGMLPPAEAVRVEEMVNYFPYAYAAPEAGAAPFSSQINVMQTPWNPDTRLVRIGLQGRLPALADRPPLNLVFLIDTSGSMEDPNKLPLLKQSFRLMLAQLRPEDEVAIVAYAGSAGEVLPPTRAENRDAILASLETLQAGGSTAGAEGLELAYKIAGKMGAKPEVSRVILATDGDFNVGIDDPEVLKTTIADARDSGIYLSVLGFGRGNLDDATMQALAQNGNGQAAYIDTLQEAQKVLVDQLSGALFPIANDVKIQVEWNPAQVAEYRLIGYETRALAREDFNNDKVDAGEIGAGHQVTALYEVTAPDSPALRNDPLRYGEAVPPKGSDELGFLRLRYKAPGETVSALIETPVSAIQTAPDDDARFAAAVAGFGQLLGGSKYLGDWGWDQAIALAEGARGPDPFGYRIEAVNLMRLSQSLSN